MQVSWPLGKYETRNIPHGADFYVDLLKFSKNEPRWDFGLQQLYSSQKDLEKYKGTYRFQLTATADNAESITFGGIDVRYDQTWDSIRAVKPAP